MSLRGYILLVEGDITGSMMFLLEEAAAHTLVNKLMGGMMEPSPDGSFSDMELSALKEIGNIIVGSYLNSLSTLTGMCIYPTPPELAIDMAEAILSVPAIAFGEMGDKMLLIQTQFTDEETLDGYFILIPDIDSYNKILSAIGM